MDSFLDSLPLKYASTFTHLQIDAREEYSSYLNLSPGTQYILFEGIVKNALKTFPELEKCKEDYRRLNESHLQAFASIERIGYELITSYIEDFHLESYENAVNHCDKAIVICKVLELEIEAVLHVDSNCQFGSLELVGSSANLFSLKDSSDVDLCLQVHFLDSDTLSHEAKSKRLMLLLKEKLNSDRFEIKELVTRARVPVIKLHDKILQLDVSCTSFLYY